MSSLSRKVLPVLSNSSCSQILYGIRSLTYKSAISLDKLYPTSSLKLTTPTKPTNEYDDRFSGFIPVDQLEITYSKSTGPGGQNVNKINTKVDLRFHLESANWINPDIKNKLAERLKTKITKEGYLLFRSDLTRSQQLNLADCLEKLRSVIRRSLVEKDQPSIESVEMARRRHEKAARERLMVKRHRSDTKSDRQGPGVYDL